MFQLNYLLYSFGNLHYNHLYILLFKGARYLISILQQVGICFHGYGKKEVNLIHVFTVYKKLGGPYQVLEVCKYAIVPTTIGKTCLKITKARFGYISGYPTHF